MHRPGYLKEIQKQFRVHPICGLLGPRQVGKTTLAKMYSEGQSVALFDLENSFDLARLDNPMLALGQLSEEFIIIDEIQRRPDLFPTLRVLADQNKGQKYLILGSASKELIKQSSETLAGRIGYIEVAPFSLDEVKEVDPLWLRGGFPKSYLAETIEDSNIWRQAYITTFLEKDIPQLGFQIPANQMRRFWLMLTHYHGQIFTSSEIGRSLGITDHMVKRYLDILAGTFMIRILQPWFENIGKRQVKSPKIYFRDSGVLFALLGIQNLKQLEAHPRMGAFWEGFALEEIIRHLKPASEECFFWATHAGAELDLLIFKNGKNIGFEVKYSESPKITPSMKSALEALKLDHLYIIYPGSTAFPFSEKVSAYPLKLLPSLSI